MVSDSIMMDILPETTLILEKIMSLDATLLSVKCEAIAS